MPLQILIVLLSVCSIINSYSLCMKVDGTALSGYWCIKKPEGMQHPAFQDANNMLF